MTNRHDMELSPSLWIGVAADIDLGLDKDDNLTLIRRNNYKTRDERIVIGPLSQSLINSMIYALDRLRVHAKP
jgi:hypothetical protein